MKLKMIKYYPGENSVYITSISGSNEPVLNIVNILTKSLTYNFEKESQWDDDFDTLTDNQAFDILIKRLKIDLKEILDEVMGRIRKLDDLKFDQVK